MTTLIRNLARAYLHNHLHSTARQIRWNSTFKAALVRKDMDTFSVEEQKRSKLKGHEVRVQVCYCSVNTNDVHVVKEKDHRTPFIPGYEFSGEVLEVGKDVKQEEIRVGEKVAALSLENFGGFAQECVVHIDDIFRLPSNVQLQDAAVLLCGHATALFAFSEKYKLEPKQYVMITAGAAGLGLAAVDVAANVYEAKVIGVVESNERAEILRNFGAFQTVQFDANLKKHVLAMTEKKGAHVAYDAVGGQMFDSINECIQPGGTIFHIIPVVDKINPPPPNSSLIFPSLLDLRRNNLETYKNLVDDTLNLASDGVIGTHISAKYNLENINEALAFITEKKCTGKVLIEVE